MSYGVGAGLPDPDAAAPVTRGELDEGLALAATRAQLQAVQGEVEALQETVATLAAKAGL
jgi:hypothetical protein